MPTWVEGCDCIGCNDARARHTLVYSAVSDGPKEEIDEDLVECPNCNAGWDEDDLNDVSWWEWDQRALQLVAQSGRWCDDCTRVCERCDTIMRNTDARYVGDDWYCDDCTCSCANENCSNLVVVDDEGSAYCSTECEHDGCGCESPQRQFSIRNDGDGVLPNDTRVTVTLPKGMISDEGICTVRNYLSDYAYQTTCADPGNGELAVAMQQLRDTSYVIDELGDMWQTKEGNYTKRLSRLAYKRFKLKVPREVISRVGCIARDHSMSVDIELEITRDLNLSPDEFANEDSCWWGGYESSRCTLKSNGGFGLRTFGASETNEWVTGRAWVLPLRHAAGGHLVPTFETLEPDAFVVFNGYGDLEGYAPARVVAHMAGWTYRKVEFSASPMFINSSSAYLVAPEYIADSYTDGNLAVSVSPHSTLFRDEQARKLNEKENEYV